jgi:cystathionine beta-lyase/cystathionine gamma-synthase
MGDMYSRVRDGLHSMKSLLIHGRFHSPKWDYSHHIVPPLSMNAAYRLESVERGGQGFQQFANLEYSTRDEQPIYIYDRLHEPTKGMLEERIAFAEKCEVGISFASGMAAISGVLLGILTTGDELVVHKTLYGCTYSLVTRWLPRYGIKVHLVDFTKLGEVEAATNANTRVYYFETPVNPNLQLIDIEKVVALARARSAGRDEATRIKTVVDNTFASPWCQRPKEFGVDFVAASLTKHITGFGTDVGGIVCADLKDEPTLLLARKDIGGSLSSHAAWGILTYGLPTLPLRVQKATENAKVLAEYLEAHPQVERVLWPGLESFPHRELALKQMRDPEGRFAPSSLIYFVLKGQGVEAQERGKKLLNYVAKNGYTMTLAVSLGQIRTLCEHPSSMTHAAVPIAEQEEAGIDPGGIRIAAGIEDVNDIIRDLDAAFDALDA